MRRRGLQGSSKGIEIEFDGELLCFTPKSSSQFKFTKDIYYSTDQEKWKKLPANTYTPPLTNKVWWYADLVPDVFNTLAVSGGIGTFSSIGEFNVSGNPRCLLKDKNLVDYSFCTLFRSCTNLVDVSGLILDDTILVKYCYGSMFYGCSRLTKTPKLLATTLADGCYHSMFQYCTSLTQAPELPTTTLARSCYHSMFQSCTSLTTAPELPATTLVNYCYYEMFEGCSKLNHVKSHATDILATDCLKDWLSGVSSTGELHKPAGVTYPADYGVIPKNWTVYEDL